MLSRFSMPEPLRRCRDIGVVLGLAIAMISPKWSAAEEPANTVPNDFANIAGAFVKKYCLDCHGGAEPKGEVALDKYADLSAMLANRPTWEKVVENLNQGAMPPEDSPRPEQAEITAVVQWIGEQFAAADRAAPPNPGRVTMRRLNRVEYNNTIRDLLGVDFHPADDFPSDDVGYGFDNIGDVLSLPPLLMEKYLAAAERIVIEAIITDRTIHPAAQRVEVERLRRANRAPDGNSVVFPSNGDIGTKFTISYAGEYAIRVRAFADQAGPDKAQMSVQLDEGEPAQYEVVATVVEPQVIEIRTQLKVGEVSVRAAFLNDYWEPEDPDPNNRDRNLYVDYLEVEGPFGAGQLPLPASHQQIIVTEPAVKEGAEAGAEWDRAAREVLSRFASRAFRRPASQDEVERLVALSRLAREGGDSFEVGMQLAIEAVLVSPHFLFRVESDEHAQPTGDKTAQAATEGRIEPLGDYPLASRLSYFLWSSMPDEALFADAAAGKLHDPAVWEAQVRRMLADPKSQALVENFAGQWLQLRNLKTINPDRKRFPDFDESLRQAMQRETELFVDAVLREDRSVLDLLDTDFTFVNERLAKHYGIEGVKGNDFQRVAVDRNRRGGILTQASVLTVTSNPTRTSPVKRDKWVLEQILNSPPPPPPPNVPELADDSDKQLTGTLRERMQQHRENVSCAACHQRMDPIGFGLENFDAIGAYREKDGEAAIDPAGELPDGSKFSGPAELKQVFRAKGPEFRRALAAKMLTYALGRGTEPYDRSTIEQIATELEADGDRFSRLILAVTKSQPFQMRQVPAELAAAKTEAVGAETGGANE